MKHKEPIALLLIGVLLSGVLTVGASEAGSVGDPLIALNWLKETFIPGAVADVENRVDEKLEEIGDQIISSGARGIELRVKRSDILWLESGSSLTPLAGTLSLSDSSQGVVIDVTSGAEIPLGSKEIAISHRYLAAEDSRIAFIVDSDTAVIQFNGAYEREASGEIDYNALAEALKTMGLFRGSDVPYGSGFDLESGPTRIQGLVMFLRLIGEEQLALNYPGSGITFTDVPEWAEPYVAYAYDRGYTNGQEIDSQWRVIFGSDQALAARDYVTFLLRALGYEDGNAFTWESAISNAQTLGVLTAGEGRLLTEKPFLRAQVVYLSYMSLSAQLVGGDGTLLDKLISSGAVSAMAADLSMADLTGQRI